MRLLKSPLWLTALTLLVGYGVAAWIAPGSGPAAVVGALGLFAAIVLAYAWLQAVAMVMAPLIVAQTAVQLATRSRRAPGAALGNVLAACVFAGSYVFFALVTGATVGWLEGGAGIFAGVIAYGLAGMVLCWPWAACLMRGE